MLRVLCGALSDHPQAMCGCLLYAGTGIMGNICYGPLGFHLDSLMGAHHGRPRGRTSCDHGAQNPGTL